MTDLVLSQGVRVINGVEMMGSRKLMSICGVGDHKHFVRDLKVLFKVQNLDFSDIKGVFVELHEEGPKKGCIKEIWFDRPRASAVAGSYDFQYNLYVHEEFDKLSNKKKIAELEKRNLPSYQIEDPIERAKAWIEEKQQHILELDEKDRAIYKLKNEKSDKEMLADAYLEHDTCKSLTTFAKEIYPQTNLGVRSIFKILRERGHWLKTTNLPSSHMVKTGKFIIKEVQCADKMVRTHGYITPKGEAWLLKGLLSYVRDEATARAVISFE